MGRKNKTHKWDVIVILHLHPRIKYWGLFRIAWRNKQINLQINLMGSSVWKAPQLHLHRLTYNTRGVYFRSPQGLVLPESIVMCFPYIYGVFLLYLPLHFLYTGNLGYNWIGTAIL